MTIDDALNTLAKKFAHFDDIKEMGNYYIEECKSALLEIIIREKPKRRLTICCPDRLCPKDRKGNDFFEQWNFNQGCDEYEKRIRELFK